MSEGYLSNLHISSPSHRRGRPADAERALSDAPVVALCRLEAFHSILAHRLEEDSPFGQVSAQCPARSRGASVSHGSWPDRGVQAIEVFGQPRSPIHPIPITSVRSGLLRRTLS